MKNIEDEVFDKLNEKFVENMFVHYLNVEFDKNGLKSAHDKLKSLYVNIREHDDENVDDSISFGIQPSEDTDDFYIEHNDEICTYKLKFHYTFNVAKESFVIATISTKYEFPRVEDDGFDKKFASMEDVQKAELIEQIKDALIVPVIADNVCGQLIPSLCFGMIDFNIFINEIWKQDYKELDVEQNSNNMEKDEKLLKELSSAIKSSFATILGDISIFTLLQFETLTSQCKDKTYEETIRYLYELRATMVEAYKDVGDSISTLNPYTMASFKSIDIFVEATRTFLAEKGNEIFNRNDYIIYFTEDLTKKMESAKKVASVKMQDTNINEAETFVDKDNGNSEDDKFDDNDKKLNINKNKFNLN